MDDISINIITLGDGMVGKTSLIRRMAENRFDHHYQMTLGIDVFKKQMIFMD